MIVLKLEKTKGTMYVVTFDNGRVINADYEILYLNRIKAGSILSEEEADEIDYKEQLRLAKKKSLNILSFKDYSCDALYEKLKLHFDDEVAVNTVAKMIELGYLDDEKYAKKLAEYCLNIKKWGFRKSHYYITTKGVKKNIAEKALLLTETDTISNIISIINKKYKDKLVDYHSKQKVIAGLMRLGFDYSDIKIAIEESLVEE